MTEHAHSIDWEFLDCDAAISVGDLVSAAAGGLPIYRVMAYTNGRAWLRDVDSGADRVTPIRDFHWKASGPRR